MTKAAGVVNRVQPGEVALLRSDYLGWFGMPDAAKPLGTGLINSYGLAWRRAEFDAPHHSRKLVGSRRDSHGLRLADFREQVALYALYKQTQPTYVGIAAHDSLLARLAAHTRDKHRDNWDSFSWFGFYGVEDQPRLNGYCALAKSPKYLPSLKTTYVLMDLEGMLHRVQSTNSLRAPFRSGLEWKQVEADDVDRMEAKVLAKLRTKRG